LPSYILNQSGALKTRKGVFLKIAAIGEGFLIETQAHIRVDEFIMAFDERMID
jgi:hypothetical protein